MARINTYYGGEIKTNQDVITLCKNESHHLSSVLRVRKKTAVVVFNGKGESWNAEVLVPHPHYTELQILGKREFQALPKNPIILAQALPKGKTFETIIEKATEIGVSEIYPIVSDHTQSKKLLDPKESKMGKWSAKTIEACKQSGNTWLPTIHSPQTLDIFLKNLDAKATPPALLLTASLEDESPLLSTIGVKSFQPGPIVFLVGPEGDFSEYEYGHLRQYEFQPVRLAANILRVDTATVYGLSVLDNLLRR